MLSCLPPQPLRAIETKKGEHIADKLIRNYKKLIRWIGLDPYSFYQYNKIYIFSFYFEKTLVYDPGTYPFLVGLII